ncbi:hypothetical protein SK128_022050 [Halocaridina rubra]|uniref:IRF tryptophan pentad repeat domain-containing protein n=1 Tax=Halocaridina rubra TaxID=373956 RepID=A0AAN8WX63_HALRR
MSLFASNQDTPMDLSVKTPRKLRLEEFLRQNLDHAPADRVIQWVNREEGVFRILWTHQSSGAFTQEDAALFRYWALARGKPANLSSVELKQSLRMALNKSPSVERVPAPQDEYRYFRFTDWGNRRSHPRTTSNHLNSDPYIHEHTAYSKHNSSLHCYSVPLKSDIYHTSNDGQYLEDYSGGDGYNISESPCSTSSVSSTSSSSTGKYSFNPYNPSEIFQLPTDHDGASYGQSTERRHKTYTDDFDGATCEKYFERHPVTYTNNLDGVSFDQSLEPCPRKYTGALQEFYNTSSQKLGNLGAFSPASERISEEELKRYYTHYMDSLSIYPPSVTAALYDRLQKQLSSSKTIERRKHHYIQP